MSQLILIFKIACIHVLILVSALSFGQLSDFQKIYGGHDDDGAFCIIQTYDGGFMLAGNTQSYGNVNGQDDILMIKTDKFGAVEWTKAFGDSLTDNASCVREAPDSGYFIAGGTNNYGSGLSDVYLLKTDKHGNVSFFKTYGGLNTEWGQALEVTSDGGCIITGGTYSSGAGDRDVFLLKTDSTGQLEWHKTYSTPNFDQGTSVKNTPDGGYVIGGRTLLSGSMEILLIKTDNQGDLLWNKVYKSTGYDESYSITLPKDGGYLIAGSTNGFGAGLVDIVLIKTDTLGNIQKSKTYGSTEADVSYSVCANRDSGFSVVGYTEGFPAALKQNTNVLGTDSANIFLLRVNQELDTLWTSVYGGPLVDESFSVIQTTDTGFAIAAFEKSYGNDSNKVYLIKTNAYGNSNCHQSRIFPDLGIPNYVVDTIPLIIDTTNFLTGTYSIKVFTTTISDSSLCNFMPVEENVNQDQMVSVYPNPFHQKTTFDCPFYTTNSNLNMTVIDMFGNIVFEQKINDRYTVLETDNLKSGVYFFRVSDALKSIATGKLLILD